MNRLFLIPVFALLAGVSLSILDIHDAQAHEYYEYEEYSSYEGYGNVPPGHLPPPEYRKGYHNVPPGHLPPPEYRSRKYKHHHGHYRYDRRYIKHGYPRYRRYYDNESLTLNAALPHFIQFFYEKHKY